MRSTIDKLPQGLDTPVAESGFFFIYYFFFFVKIFFQGVTLVVEKNNSVFW
jgi:hypothetical protein